MSLGSFEDRLHPRDLHGRFRSTFPHPPKPPALGRPIGEDTPLSRGVAAARVKAPVVSKPQVVPISHGLNVDPSEPSLTGLGSDSDMQSMAAYKGLYYNAINSQLRGAKGAPNGPLTVDFSVRSDSPKLAQGDLSSTVSIRDKNGKVVGVYIDNGPEFPPSSVWASEEHSSNSTYLTQAFQDWSRKEYGDGTPIGAAIEDVDQVMKTHRTDKPVTVGRLMGRGFANTLKEGDAFTDRGFVSTSRSYEGLEYFGEQADRDMLEGNTNDVIAKIRIPAGTRAFDFGPDDEESEMVLDRGMKFTVIGEQRTPEGNKVLLLRASGTSHNS